jgi:hypothetical protein
MEPVKRPPVTNTPPSVQPAPNPPETDIPKPVPSKEKFGRVFYFALGVVLLLITIGAIYWLFRTPAKTTTSTATASTASHQASPQGNSLRTVGQRLDTSHNYGDKYANGILPVGDNKYVTDAAKQGYVFACSGYANNMKQSQGGAGRRGPWFVGTTQYDLNKKLHVKGSVTWQAEFSNKVAGSTRTIVTNDLPNHTTGVFPISAADPAYAYDRNPNAIKGQTFTYSLSANPSYGNPSCIGGQVGVMLTGVALFSGFDAAGRDAGAWEVQDSCDGHPEKTGTYHYHTLSSCIKDISVKTVIGFALDGFPITGPQVGKDNILTSSDLDACHGITSQVVLDGKTVTTYHYVMTQDFPYSVACYRAQAIQPPGQGAAGKP